MRVLSLLLFLSLAQPAQAAADFDTWAEGVAAARLRAEPQLATQSQSLPAAEQALLDAQLTPTTAAHRAERIAAARMALAELAAFDRKALTPAQRTSAATVEWSLRMIVEAEPFGDFEYVFSQTRGLHVSLVNFLSQTHPIRNTADISHYLSRLAQVAERMDTGIARAREAAGRGVLMPRFITVSALGQFERFLAEAPARNVLVASLDERAGRVPGLPPEERAKAVAAAEKLVAESVIPAFRRAEALLKAQLPQTGDDAGLWRLPGGDKAYAFELRRNTTTDFSPRQIHALGLAEVARIEAEMDRLLRKLGRADGSVRERYTQLETELQPTEPNPQPALIARFEAIVRDAEQRAKLLFDRVPRSPIVVKREPPFTEKTAAAHYSAPARDGSQPAVFWAPLPGPRFGILGMRTLAHHEGVPGHHFQIALAQENEALPRYRRGFLFGGGSAYVEGWALYAEQLAVEAGWYGDAKSEQGEDIPGRLGQLNGELFRARRLVVDTGLHAMKWTRQQAIAYGISAQEVERYVVGPGQACAYKLGMLHILALREKARKALGPAFSLKAFHNTVLGTGNVPLAVLSEVVDEWIAAGRAASSSAAR